MVNILAVIKDNLYLTKIDDFVNEAAATNDRVLYISLNKTYSSLSNQMQRKGIVLDKFYFIDTITATLIPVKNTNRCTYLSTPTDVHGLYAAIIKQVKLHDIDLIIFDSLSTFTTYHDLTEITHFISTLLGSLTLLDCSIVMTCLKSEENTQLIKRLYLLVDKRYYFKRALGAENN